MKNHQLVGHNKEGALPPHPYSTLSDTQARPPEESSPPQLPPTLSRVL